MPGLFTDTDRRLAQCIARLNGANPFLPERIACEREALGDEFVDVGADWNQLPPAETQHPNPLRLTVRSAEVIERVRVAWLAGGRAHASDAKLYEELVSFWLFHRYAPRFDAVIRAALEGGGSDGALEFYAAFRKDAERFLELPGLNVLQLQPVHHLFSCAFQVRRAFHNIFRSLVGRSRPMVQLRAAIWQSIFTHDLGRYRRVLHRCMGDFATLVTGPSGTGKELVARAIALSRYLPFDLRRGGFVDDFAGAFHPLNLSALSPTLVESELFGHRRGAFTGALTDRAGWMETCPASGAVFLDEIGDVDPAIQVKLLRVLQSRTFQRLGETEPRRFEGKIIAATNRDLPALIRSDRFREDFYYRLCSDLVRTPSLREQLDAAPEDLNGMVRFITTRIVGEDEGETLAEETTRWIERRLGAAYPWPGNFRELEQCVRNVMVRGEYQPAAIPPTRSSGDGDWLQHAREGRLTAEQLLSHYTRLVFTQAGTIEETARRLDLDRRTVKARVPLAGRVTQS
jgi:DNA-binding NtrC family response regulator